MEEVDSKRCIYCDSENHTFKHMVFECIHCTNFIYTNYNLTITYRMIIMGEHNNLRINNLISVITYQCCNVAYCNNTSLLQFIKKDIEFKMLTYKLNEKSSEEYIPLKELLIKLNKE